MAIIGLSTSNTFSHWITTTQELASRVNEFVAPSGNGTTIINTNLDVANNLVIGGNLHVSGTFILDQYGLNDLDVSGNLSVTNNLSSNNGIFQNLSITNNVSRLNVSTTVDVGTNTKVYGVLNVSKLLTSTNLTATGNLYFHNTNVYASNVSIVTTQVSGNLVVSGNATLSNSTTNYGNFETANITLLLGQANTKIYETISNTTAARTVASNISAMTAFAVALG